MTLRHLARVLANQDLQDNSGCEVYNPWEEGDIRRLGHALGVDLEGLSPTWYEDLKPLFVQELTAAKA